MSVEIESKHTVVLILGLICLIAMMPFVAIICINVLFDLELPFDAGNWFSCMVLLLLIHNTGGKS